MKKRKSSQFAETDSSYPVVMLPDNSRFVLTWPHLAVELMADGEELGLTASQIFLHIETRVKANRTEKEDTFRDGEWWMYSSLRGWQDLLLWIKSPMTISKAIHRLINLGLIIVDTTGEYNKKRYDETWWYRINYDAASKLRSIRVDNYNPTENTDLQFLEEEAPAPPEEEPEEETPEEEIIFDQYFPVDDDGNPLPVNKHLLAKDPLFLEIKTKLFGSLANFKPLEITTYLTQVKGPCDDIEKWEEWCKWQAENNAEGKTWKQYVEFLYKGMEMLPNGYRVSRDSDFNRWRNGKFVGKDEVPPKGNGWRKQRGGRKFEVTIKEEEEKEFWGEGF